MATEKDSPFVLEHVRRRLGDIGQVASVRPVRLQDGPEDGVRALDVRVAGGLHVLVLTDRGMDLGPAWHLGHPLAWISPTGVVHPAFAERRTWLRSFHGGLLVTAGLQNVGPECEDADEAHGLHGRASNTPARGVRWEVREDGPVPLVEISGIVRESAVFGSDLQLTRTLRFPVGRPCVELHDVVENRGYAPAPLMLLYHFNLGWPVVDEDAIFVAPDRTVVPFDPLAAANLADHATLGPPVAGAGPEVFEHVLEPVPQIATVGVVNERFAPTGGLGVAIDYRPAQLPRLWQWRMRGHGMYLTGVEPANCGVRGRDVERAGDAVDILGPGERRTFDLTVTAHAGEGAACFARCAGVSTVTTSPGRNEQ
jgi:Domain of unknown function (DUF4432)